jgi:hypothetical protein
MALPAKKFDDTECKPPTPARWTWEPPAPPKPETCANCESRWEDVRFYGLPGSALCGRCPHRAEWTGRLFDVD